MEKEKRKCLFCKISLTKIGIERKNGKINQKDWNGRKYHKSCWEKNKYFIQWQTQQQLNELIALEQEFENLINN